jgi:carbon monoxide dehydrogenase subunit G
MAAFGSQREAAMSVSVKIELGYEFEVRAKFEEVFAVLSDVPRSVSHFPKVDRLTDLGDGVYKLAMKRLGTEQVNLQTVYASKYVSDKAAGTITWIPVPGVGNALVGGSWKITDHKGRSTDCVLNIEGTVDVPLPGLMKPVVVPVVESEFERAVEKYIDNLIEEFGGEV